MTDIATIGPDFFKPHEGAIVALADETGAVVLTASLKQVVEEERATRSNAPRRAFTLVLQASGPCSADSGNYTLAHPDFGTIGPVHVNRMGATEPGGTQVCFRVYFN